MHKNKQELTNALLRLPPERLWCETRGWVGDCPNSACANYLKAGRLCARTLGDLFDHGETNPGFCVRRDSAETIGWALGLSRRRVYQIEQEALVKLRKRTVEEAA